MKKPYEVSLELFAEGVKQTGIRYVSGDAGTMPLSIRLVEPPGGFPENAEARLSFRNSVFDEWQRETPVREFGTLLYEIDPADIAVAGTVEACVTVVGDTQRLTWQRFALTVDKGVLEPSPEPPDYLKDWRDDVLDRLRGVETAAPKPADDSFISSLFE